MHLSVEERYVRAAGWARRRGHIVIAEILEGWDIDGSAQDERKRLARKFKVKKKLVELEQEITLRRARNR